MNPVEIIAAGERDFAAAHLTLDLAVLEQLYHPDFVIAQPDGMVESKVEVLDSYRSGERHWDLAEVDQLDIRVAGHTGIAIGRWRAIGTNRGQSFNYAARFLSVWTQDGGTWRNIAYTATEIPF